MIKTNFHIAKLISIVTLSTLIQVSALSLENSQKIREAKINNMNDLAKKAFIKKPFHKNKFNNNFKDISGSHNPKLNVEHKKVTVIEAKKSKEGSLSKAAEVEQDSKTYTKSISDKRSELAKKELQL